MTTNGIVVSSSAPLQKSNQAYQEIELEVPPKNIKRLDDPFNRKRYLYEALVPITEAVKIPLGTANPRFQNLNSDVSREIRESLAETPETFHQRNRGLWIAARQAEYDNQRGRLFLSFPTEEGGLYGILDGGHTLRNIEMFLGEREDSDEKPIPYVMLHIRIGVEDELPELSASLNRSYRLKDYSIMNAEGEFDDLRKLLRKKLPFEGKIDFKENGAGIYDIVDVLQRMSLFCKGIFDGDEDKHPIEAYRSKARCLEYFRKNEKEFLALEPILLDCFRLPDQIERLLPEVSGSGRFGGYQFVEPLKKAAVRTSLDGLEPYPDIDTWARKYNVSAGITFPIAASLRVLVRRRSDGTVSGWRENPVTFFLKNGNKLFQPINQAEDRSPSVLGKDPTLWGKLYHRAYRCLYPED